MILTFNPEFHVNKIVDWIKEYFLNNGPDSKAVIGISGGKDSSIVAALLVRALGKERVVGVKMPQGSQSDIDAANQLIEYLDIPSFEINIGSACSALYDAIDVGYDYDHCVKDNSMVATNTPARIRMATLYAVAALVGGRVVNTCNYSEDYVGYSTKYGDGAGDFSPLGEYTVREILLIGDYLNLPHELIYKVPSDGMCGKTDEENLGFSYATLDAYLLEDVKPDYETYKKIETAHRRNIHKLRRMPVFRKPYENEDNYSF